MNRVSYEFERVYNSYISGEITLTDFQFRLEPFLRSFDEIDKLDRAEINEIINQLEIIIYTLPEADQEDAVKAILPEIRKFIEKKR